jgi:hypothetical protein
MEGWLVDVFEWGFVKVCMVKVYVGWFCVRFKIVVLKS